MKALIFNPYFDTLGGGERYTAGVIKTLLDQHCSVSVFWHDEDLLDKLKQRFNIDCKYALVDTSGYQALALANLWRKKQIFSNYDVVFWVSDGSVPFLFGKKNILHFQVPFSKVNGRTLINKIKFHTINKIVCNSAFTKDVIDKSYGVKSEIVYPPCQMIEPVKKEKIILAVGRFDGLLHNKRQDILIESLRKLNLSGWTLVMAGGDMNETNNLTTLKQIGVGLPIEWVVNQNFEILRRYYASATLFWHAAGFGVNQGEDPEKVEHFGMSTVEAMSAGAVPLVFAAGGQKEIVRDGENGYLWQSEAELINQTVSLINNPKKILEIAHNARESSQQFSQASFAHAIKKLLS